MIRQLYWKRIPLFETYYKKVLFWEIPMGTRLSKENNDWDKEVSNFNKLVTSDKRNKRIKIDWQLMANCLATSYQNKASATLALRGQATADVIDMPKTFGKYLKKGVL